jgi:hypothetical protein
MQNGKWFGLTLACLGAACQAPLEGAPEVGAAVQALSVCDEMVPANRNVDGIPAYAQCEATQNSAIYSNNGVDTSTTQMGSDWVRTQYSGGYQCTEFAHRYWHFKWNVKWIPNGNAGTWCDTQPPANSGVIQTMTPVHGDVMVLAPGSCGADGTTGHVNVVDVFEPGATKLTAVEQNGARRGQYNVSCAKCFLHIVANDGSGAPATGAGGAPAPSNGGGAPPPTAAGGTGAAAPSRPMRPARAGSDAPAQTPPPTTPVTPASSPNAAGSGAPAAAPSGPTFAGSGATGPGSNPIIVPWANRDSAESGSCSTAGALGTNRPLAAIEIFAASLAWLFLRRRTGARRSPVR